MAKQEAIGYEVSKEWQDFQTGGTRIDAADLNHIEGGVSEACNAIDELRTKRLVTYMVLQDGETATQDAYGEAILGPCLILDLAERATYYDNGEDGEAHERNLITSGADIDALRDSISQVKLYTISGKEIPPNSYLDFVFELDGFSSVTFAVPAFTTASESYKYGLISLAATSWDASAVTVRLYNGSDARVIPTVRVLVVGR